MTDRHPIQENIDGPLEEQIRLTRIALAQLWDEVWWMRLPFWRRWLYRLQGFTDPIESFYEEE